MEENNQSDILLSLLRQMRSKHILKDLMLVGSWCLPIYRENLVGAKNIPALRTWDVDLLIPNPKALTKQVDMDLP